MREWVIFIIQILSIATMTFLLLTWRKALRERDEARGVVIAMGTFIDALAKRGTMVRCDDCGNLMPPDTEIDLIEKDDGTIYLGHRSHDRRHDWGKV